MICFLLLRGIWNCGSNPIHIVKKKERLGGTFTAESNG